MNLYNDNIPLTVYDIINDNSNNIHKELFKEAIKSYLEENPDNFDEEAIRKYLEEDPNNFSKDNKDRIKIIDNVNRSSVLKPSIATIIYNNQLKYVDLTSYWNKNYVETKNKYINNEVFNELLISDEDKKNVEMVYIDYVNGRVQFKNKFTNKTFFISFNKLDKNKEYFFKLKNTFDTVNYAK